MHFCYRNVCIASFCIWLSVANTFVQMKTLFYLSSFPLLPHLCVPFPLVCDIVYACVNFALFVCVLFCISRYFACISVFFRAYCAKALFFLVNSGRSFGMCTHFGFWNMSAGDSNKQYYIFTWLLFMMQTLFDGPLTLYIDDLRITKIWNHSPYFIRICFSSENSIP